MYGCMDVWMYGCIDVWMYGCMVRCVYGCDYVYHCQFCLPPIHLVDFGHIGHGDDFLELCEFVDACQRVDQLRVQDLFLDVLPGHLEVGHEVLVVVDGLRRGDDHVVVGGVLRLDVRLDRLRDQLKQRGERVKGGEGREKESYGFMEVREGKRRGVIRVEVRVWVRVRLDEIRAQQKG